MFNWEGYCMVILKTKNLHRYHCLEHDNLFVGFFQISMLQGIVTIGYNRFQDKRSSKLLWKISFSSGIETPYILKRTR